MRYCVYILKCADKTLYTGYTNNLSRRLKRHNGELAGGAKYTRGRGPVKLVYTETFKSLSKALKREAEIKRFTRGKKLALISH